MLLDEIPDEIRNIIINKSENLKAIRQVNKDWQRLADKLILDNLINQFLHPHKRQLDQIVEDLKAGKVNQKQMNAAISDLTRHLLMELAQSGYLPLISLKSQDLEPYSQLIDLSAMNMEGLQIPNSNMQNVNMSNSMLRYAKFDKSNLSSAHFQNCDLNSSSFQSSNLQNADFSNSDLSRSDFNNANVENSDFSNANLQNARISLEQLKTTKSIIGANLTIHPHTRSIILGDPPDQLYKEDVVPIKEILTRQYKNLIQEETDIVKLITLFEKGRGDSILSIKRDFSGDKIEKNKHGQTGSCLEVMESSIKKLTEIVNKMPNKMDEDTMKQLSAIDSVFTNAKSNYSFFSRLTYASPLQAALLKNQSMPSLNPQQPRRM